MSTPEGVLAAPLDHLSDPDPAIRRLAVSLTAALIAEPWPGERVLAVLTGDPDGAVRAAAAEALGGLPEGSPLAGPVSAALLDAVGDTDVRAVEAAVTALGELPPRPAVVARLLAVAADDAADKLVREAAVASLGALADPVAVPVLLELLATGPPQVRRRAVVALTVFDDPAVEPALRRATADRNPMVREVAAMVVSPPHLVGRGGSDTGPKARTADGEGYPATGQPSRLPPSGAQPR
jgi:HEAT repeat protein